MARKRHQEDVFRPLNESPTAEAEEPQRSGRGWEIKIGLLALALVVGATGYVAYSQLRLAESVDETAAGSSRLQPEADADQTVASQVVPAHVLAVVEPELKGVVRPFVTTQPSAISDSETLAEADAWISPESVVDQVPQTLQADPGQSYAANYGGDPDPQGTPAETTFDPMPNPGGFTAGTAAPLPSAAPVATPGPIQQSPYGDRVAATVPQSTLPSYPPAQTDSTGFTRAYEFRAASRSDGAPASSAPPAEVPTAPTYTRPSESYAPAYTPEQGPYAGPATGTSPYAGPSATAPPTQDPYQSYPSRATSRTQAGYAGLPGNSVADGKVGAEAWQQPSVVLVDGKYAARPNDNFYTISKKVYGSGAYFEALARYNNDKYPKANQIRIGDVVQTPSVETLEDRYPELCPKPEHRDAAKRRSAAGSSRSLAGRRVYVVQEGDSLFDIARFELGARAKVADLIDLNRDVLGDQINYLTPGMRLLLPETDNRGPAVTQGPTNTLR